MTVRCKFYVSDKGKKVSNGGQTVNNYVKLWVTYDPDFHTMTPSGAVELELVKDEVADFFEIGRHYEVDFRKVE